MHNQSQLHGEVEAYALRALAANGFGDAMVARTEQRFFLPSSVRPGHGASAPRPSRLAQLVETTLRAVHAVAQQTVARWKQRRVARASYFALRELDARTLRDLGFDRSEIRSIAAEVAGEVDSTRARLVLTRHDLPR